MRKYEGYSGRGAGRYWRHAGIVWGMRDIIGEMRWGMMGGGYAGRTTSPKSARPGCRFLDQPPPIHEERETGTANDLLAEKKMLILYLTC